MDRVAVLIPGFRRDVRGSRPDPVLVGLQLQTFKRLTNAFSGALF